MSEIITSYAPVENDGVESLSASGNASVIAAPCEQEDIIPIYPVRIAWGDLKGDVNSDFTYPKSLSAFSAPNSPAATAGFALRRLRAGHVYIFDVGSKVWSVFSYKPDDTPAGGTFTHQIWRPGYADWQQCAAATPFAHVPDSATDVYICFLEEHWSREIIGRANANTDGFRDKVMTRVRLTSPSDATFSAPLEHLSAKVEEFSASGLVQPHEDWKVLSETPGRKLDPSALSGTPMAQNKSVPAIMIALHDPVGVTLEMAMCHSNRTAVRAEYLEANAYALATARATQVLQDQANQQLRRPDIGFWERRALRKWGQAIRPERDIFLVESEQTLADFEVATTGSLDAWQKYIEMGLANPTGTPGSIQTHLLNFDPESEDAREVAALGQFAHDCVSAIVSSQAGQDRLGKVLLPQDRWTEQINPVKLFLAAISRGIAALKIRTDYLASIRSAADELMRDISFPMAMQISKLQRVDLLQEINNFSKVIYGRTLQQVTVDITDATREVNRRPRVQQSTQRFRGGGVLHRVRTPTTLYKFDGSIHVSGPDGVSAVGAAGAGFGVFANTLNMMIMFQAMESSPLRGSAGAIGYNPYLGMTLTALDTINKLFDLKLKAGNAIGAGNPRSYRITGNLNRAQLTALMKGKVVTQDLVSTLIDSKGTQVARIAEAAPQRTLMATVGTKILSAAGIALGVLDLFKAAEAHRRGDSIATFANIALGVGAILMASGAVFGFSTGVTLVGAIVGLILMILGLVLSFFIDDPVTAWLKNGYWGTSGHYLYWDDRDRGIFSAAGGSVHTGQRKIIIEGAEGYDIPRYFAREMQQFHEFIYSPQNAPDPPSISSYETNWLGVRRRQALPRAVYEISFRLPNYIEGYSHFEGKVLAQLVLESAYRRTTNIIKTDVSEDFWETASYGPDDLVTGKFEITVPDNANNNVVDDIRWSLLSVELAEGWVYAPLPDLVLPRKYDDDFFGGGWTDEGAGEGKALVISGSG